MRHPRLSTHKKQNHFWSKKAGRQTLWLSCCKSGCVKRSQNSTRETNFYWLDDVRHWELNFNVIFGKVLLSFFYLSPAIPPSHPPSLPSVSYFPFSRPYLHEEIQALRVCSQGRHLCPSPWLDWQMKVPQENYSLISWMMFFVPSQSECFQSIYKLIIWLRKSLHCDWLRAGKFIVNSSMICTAVQINARAFAIFSVL